MLSYIMYGQKKKAEKKCVAIMCLVSVFVLSGCGVQNEPNENQMFRVYTEAVFCSEVASNTVSLHYTLKNPEAYGIQDVPVTFGSFSSDSVEVMAAAENMQQALLKFRYDELDVQNQITYDVMNYWLKNAKESAEFLLYEEPLGVVNGVQTQLPVVLSEYQFYDRDDVETYLALMRSVDEYVNELISFEEKKAEHGLFMPYYSAETVQEQCSAFLNMGDGNYLYSTFVDKVMEMDELTENEKSDYIQENARVMEEYVYPSYEKLAYAVKRLQSMSENQKGLCYLPDGKEYYELTVRQATGSDKSVPELQDMTRRQIVEDLEGMEQIVGTKTVAETAAQAGDAVDSEAGNILLTLEAGIKDAFPEHPDTDLEVKYVPEAMEEHMSPAFYMIPAIDNTEQNVIYINQAQIQDNLTLFTTLAHEGYPGHLYQTVFYEATNPDPVRSLFDFGGYVEGWATYAEMCSYYLTPLPKEQAALIQKNSSIILGLYALADMGIHYEGWSKMDTVSFFSNYGITDGAAAERIYELIIGSPGNYLKYYIGYVEFMELKKQWVDKYGDSFSQKEFHEAVLTIGPAPFSIVEQYMWDI